MTATVAITVDKFLREYIAQLVDGGYAVNVVATPGPELETAASRMSNVVATALPMVRGISPLLDVVAFIRWISLLARGRPLAIVAMTPKAALLSILAGFVMRVPCRLYVSGGLRLEGSRGLSHKVLWLTEWLTCATATEVVTNSESLRSAYLREGLCAPHKVRTTVPGSSHGVDSAHFAPRTLGRAEAKSLGISLDQPVVLFVGRLTRDKGIDALISACELVASRGIEFELIVVGPQNEPDAGTYLRMLAGSTVRSRAVGAVSDVRPYFAGAALHVLPSLREGFPNVVLEAAAMGLPSVVSDATGCVDSVRQGETGLVVPVGDAAALADAIAALLSDAVWRKQLGASAAAWVRANFEPARVVSSALGTLLLQSSTERELAGVRR